MGQCICCDGPTVVYPRHQMSMKNMRAGSEHHKKQPEALTHNVISGVAHTVILAAKETHGSVGRCVSKGGSALQFEARVLQLSTNSKDHSRRLQLPAALPPHPQEMLFRSRRRRASVSFDCGSFASSFSNSDNSRLGSSKRSGDPSQFQFVDSISVPPPASGDTLASDALTNTDNAQEESSK